MKINEIKNYVRKIPLRIWLLVLIMAVGIFLRTYHFHDWLHFGRDQARDAQITQAVARGESDWPLLGATMGNTHFQIGPAYYYFQIISGKIFGQDPAVLAYPDLIFSLLSILLLYFFLKRYFSPNLSLVLSGLYAVSYFSVEYSRFAWNPNSIPFFSILFLMSLYEFLVSGEKTRWVWIIALGIALGIGVQLHATMLILLPATLFLSVIFLLAHKKWNIWKKLAVIVLIAIVLNLPQIINEKKSDYKNTKTFLNSLVGSSSDKSELAEKLELNVACHAQANAHILTSLGDKYDCNFLYIFSHKNKVENYPMALAFIVGSFLFVLFGYGRLVYGTIKDNDRKRRYFLGLLILYSVLFFPLLTPAIDGASHRYFIAIIFLPYIFLGFLIEWLIKKKLVIWWIIGISIIVCIVGANIFSIGVEAGQFFEKVRGNSGYAVLGEMENMADYMAARSQGKKSAYLSGGSMYLPWYAAALNYVAMEKNLDLIREKDGGEILPGDIIFYIWNNSDKKIPAKIEGREVEEYMNFGQLRIYKLKN